MLSQLEFDAGWAPTPGDLDAFPGCPRVDFGAWMQTLRRGDISFFRLSLSCPKIFSTHAVSCCLNSMAGYRASTCGRESLRPTSFEGDLSV